MKSSTTIASFGIKKHNIKTPSNFGGTVRPRRIVSVSHACTLLSLHEITHRQRSKDDNLRKLQS